MCRINNPITTQNEFTTYDLGQVCTSFHVFQQCCLHKNSTNIHFIHISNLESRSGQKRTRLRGIPAKQPRERPLSNRDRRFTRSDLYRPLYTVLHSRFKLNVPEAGSNLVTLFYRLFSQKPRPGSESIESIPTVDVNKLEAAFKAARPGRAARPRCTTGGSDSIDCRRRPQPSPFAGPGGDV